ncbi:MAG: DUF433 domain-containing protein [Helicobacteraceae bacterium]|jgi:uncharacterized protein (DUF433 family)|nr:DUF433 domain-containing protein [Helicobacteraceae bacterium]
MTSDKLPDQIALKPNARFGEPRLKGAQIAAGGILLRLSEGITRDKIAADSPEIKEDRVKPRFS